MLNAISDYIRNLAIFLLFMSFVGIVAPGEKYRDYINLIMGFMLIFLMVNPLVNMVNSWDNILFSLEQELDFNASPDTVAAQELQMALILENAGQMLIPQIENIVREHNFEPASINIDISDQEDSFLEIRNITISLENPSPEGIIQIEIISPGAGSTGENTRILALKNELAGFYNLSPDHIHIQ